MHQAHCQASHQHLETTCLHLTLWAQLKAVVQKPQASHKPMPNTCLQLSLQASHKAVVQASVLRLLLQQLASTSPLAALVLRLSKSKCGLPVGA